MSESTLTIEPKAEKIKESPAEKRTILFVCTGNTCRSPMCVALFNALYAGKSLRAESCGLAADGSPISPNAVAALIRRGIKSEGDNDYLSHISRPVTEELMEKAALVVGMTGRHAMELMFRYPAFASKITALSRDISDPYGGDVAVYERCLREMEDVLCEDFLREDFPSETSGEGDGGENDAL